jgi:hypothetical protein
MQIIPYFTPARVETIPVLLHGLILQERVYHQQYSPNEVHPMFTAHP